MTKFERWLFKRMLRRLFIQGPEHHTNAAKLYAFIRAEWQGMFTEDNEPTTDMMLREAFESSQWEPHYSPGMWIEQVESLRYQLEKNRAKHETIYR